MKRKPTVTVEVRVNVALCLMSVGFILSLPLNGGDGLRSRAFLCTAELKVTKFRRQNVIPGRCVFCGGLGLSKEHIFSNWLVEQFPRSAQDTHTVGVSRGRSPFELRQRQGHSGTRKVRAVCETCNNTWMSVLDEEAKRIALPLIQGKSRPVSPAEQVATASWLSKIAMVGDSQHRDMSHVTQAQRDLMRHEHRPPAPWQVWIFSYEGVDYRDLAMLQRSGPVDFTRVAPSPDQFNGYVQSTLIGMGKLLALVVAHDLPRVQFNIGMLAAFGRRIWPVSEGLYWPLSPLSDTMANDVRDIMDTLRVNFSIRE